MTNGELSRDDAEMLASRLHDLREAASDVRLQSYKQSDRDDIDTVVAYLWNLRLSETLYPILAIFEVALRNAIHNAMTSRFSTENWFDQEGLLEDRDQEEIADARFRLERNDTDVNANEIVSHLSLGFWVALLQRQYSDQFWDPDGGALLEAVFPYAPENKLDREDLWQVCNRARVLRNRVAHYRPVFNQEHLEQDHARIVTVVGWMSRAMHDLVVLTDRFDDVWADGHAQARGRLGEIWKSPASDQ